MLSLATLLLCLAADAQPADTVVVCPQEFVAALDPLLAYRHAQGHRFLYVPNTWSEDEIRAAIRRTAKNGKLKAVLLVGDADPAAADDPAIRARCVPAHRVPAKINVKYGSEPEIATDNWYADLDDDELPDLTIGRIPADSPKELAGIVAKILAYETKTDFGPWRQRVNLVAGVGGFGPVVDSVVEMSTKKLLTEGIPSGYTTNMTFGNWRSPFCPDPRRFHEMALARHNEGCLFWVYIGHGHPTGLDQVEVPGGRFHIMNCDDCGKLNGENGSPIAIMLACYTAAYDRPKDCLAEEMLRSPGGPVAVLGGSRVTMPYAMAVMGAEMLDEYFTQEPATLGEVVLHAKRRMVAPVNEKEALKHANRLILDGLAGVMSPNKDQLAEERHEHLHLFNLLGDPNLKLIYPQNLKLEIAGEALAGATLRVKTSSRFSGRALVEFLSRRDSFKTDLGLRERFDPSNAGLASYQGTYEQANDRIWAQKVVDLPASSDGSPLLLDTDLIIPAEARGAGHVRVFVQGEHSCALGVENVFLRAKRPVVATP